MTSSHAHPLTMMALLLAGAIGATARAETPLPDPVAPAVIGRPLDQIRPARRSATAPAKPAKSANAGKGARSAPLARAAAPVPHAAARGAPVQKTAVAPPPMGGIPAQQTLGAAAAEPDTPMPRQAKMALDDRADTRIRTDDVGKGTHFARKPLGPGAYFDDKDRAAVRKYYEGNPPGGHPPQWQIGEVLPAGAPVGAVPRPVMATLPKLPPGHRYVQLGGDILLVAAGSKMVVDGISVRAGR
jgi:hypothetical protein